MKKIFKERPMPDGIEFKEKNYGKTAAVLTAAGGIAAAVGPFAGMTAVSKLDKSFGEDDFVTVLDGVPVTAGGNALDLSPVEADDYLFGCRSGYEVITGAREAFETIGARFGEYGAREVFGKSFESALSPADLKEIVKSGFNCIVIPVRSFLLFKDEKINKKSLRVKRLDKVIKKCSKSGIYVILSLCDAPGFDPARGDFSVFGEGRDSLSKRNYIVKLWEKLALHYKDEPAVLAYGLLNTDCIDTEKYGEVFDSLYTRTEKAIRETGDRHILLGYKNALPASPSQVLKGDRQESCIYCKPKDFIDVSSDSFEDMGVKAAESSKTESFTRLA